MSKAFLILDKTPTRCYECPFVVFEDREYPSCHATFTDGYNDWFGRDISVKEYDSKCRPDWCPLKPWPEKKDVGFSDSANDDFGAALLDMYERFFNEVLEELETGANIDGLIADKIQKAKESVE